MGKNKDKETAQTEPVAQQPYVTITFTGVAEAGNNFDIKSNAPSFMWKGMILEIANQLKGA